MRIVSGILYCLFGFALAATCGCSSSDDATRKQETEFFQPKFRESAAADQAPPRGAAQPSVASQPSAVPLSAVPSAVAVPSAPRVDSTATVSVSAPTDADFRKSITDMLRDQSEQITRAANQIDLLKLQQEKGELPEARPAAADKTDSSPVTNRDLVEMVREQTQRLNELIGQMQLLAARQSQVEQNARLRSPAARPLPGRNLVSVLKRSSSYGEGIRLYQAKKYQEAIRVFAALRRSSASAYIRENSTFWSGVSQFHLKRYQAAIDHFASIIRNRHAAKRESALMMLGQTFEARREFAQARAAFAQLAREHPAGQLHGIASRKLAALQR